MSSPTQRTDITGQPIRIRNEKEYILEERFEKFEAYVHKREHEILGNIHGLSLVVEDRRQENAAQIEGVREQLDKKFGEAIKANNISAAKLHERIEATSDGLRAEIDDKAKETRKEISDLPGKLVELLRNTGAIGGRKS